MDDRRRFELLFFGVVFAISALIVGAIFLPYLAPLFIAATLAIVFEPVYRRVTSFSRLGAGVNAFLTVALIILLFLIPVSFFAVRVVSEGIGLYATILDADAGFISGKVAEVIHEQLPSVDLGELSANAGSLVARVAGWLFDNLGAFFSGVTGFFADSLLTLIALYYFLKEGERIRATLFRLIPLADHYKEELTERLVLSVNSVVRGSLVVAFLQGVMATLGFVVFGVPSPAFWGALTVVAALVPVVGTMIVVLPAVGYLAIASNMTNALGLAVWGIVVVGLVDNLTRPQLLHRGVNIHPLIILLAVLGGLEYFGPVGFILGPVAVSLFSALIDIYPHIILRKQPSAV